MIRRYCISCVFMLLMAADLCAQSAIQQAQRAFNRGKYEDAEQLYDAAASLSANAEEKAEYYDRAKRCRTCVKLLYEAETLYANAGGNSTSYEQAKDKYQQVLAYNSHDEVARQGVLACEREIADIANRELEKKVWDKVRLEDKKEKYHEFLKDFSNGYFANQARERIRIIEDRELWEEKDRIGTEEAYKDYLASTESGLYVSEAEQKIGAIHDDVLWAAVMARNDEAAYREYINDSTNLYKGHLPEAQARLSIIVIGRYADAGKVDSREVVDALEAAEGIVEFDEKISKLYEKSKAQVDYEAFLKSPGLYNGKAYLKKYPDSRHYDDVSETVAQLLLRELNINSTSADYQTALSYARTESTRKQIESRQKMWKSYKAKEKRVSAWRERFSVGVGGIYEFIGSNYVWGPRAEVKVGTLTDLLNVYAGFQYSVGGTSSEYLTSLKLEYHSLPVYGGLELNVVRLKNSSISLGVEASYDFPLKASCIYYPLVGNGDEETRGDEVIEEGRELLNATWSLSGRLGLAFKRWEFGVYYKHLMSPLYNDSYLDRLPAFNREEAYSIKSLESASRLGAYLIFNIEL